VGIAHVRMLAATCRHPAPNFRSAQKAQKVVKIASNKSRID
jgi:hypothetical protein